jgi:hypothetical protein
MSPKNQLEEEFTKKFMCAEKFARDIEEIVKNDNDLDYIGAIVFYCENNNIELESVPKLISKPLKEKIRWNAMELNFLKKTSKAKLPV